MGHLSVKKVSSSVAMPTGPEQLRLRLTVMYNALAMMAGRADLELRSAEAGAMIRPWTLVLGYEHAIRKFGNKLVSQEGYKFGEALKQAWKDATIKERHFISPPSLYGKRIVDPPPAPFAGAERPGKGGKGRQERRR